MVGGGPGSFIGPVHRMAAELDGMMLLVAGAFSSDPGRLREAAAGYGVDPERAYPDVAALVAGERNRPDGARVVCIATPNHLHLPAARAALEAGFAVISDKPATSTLDEAITLAEVVRRTGGFYTLTYTYSGYAMLREARALIADGALGRVRKAVVEYPQGWLAGPIERQGSRQAAWRTDPARAGAGGCIGDIGVHAFHALEFVTGQRVMALSAQLSAVVPGRTLDDDCNILLELGADRVPAVLHASQIAAGARNGLRIRVWGEQGGLDWSHEVPDQLRWDDADGTARIRYAGIADASPFTAMATRLPPGHPEGFIEAFATLYREAALVLGGERSREDTLLPTVADGVRSMVFIDRAVASARSRRWTDMPDDDGAR